MDESRSPAPQRRLIAPGPDPLVGRVINDRYRIVGTIARGGMGKVYRAEQQPLGRLVALKVLSPNYTGDSDPEFHKRFFLEASTASKLSHPNTVTIFDYGKTNDDIYYIAMELLEGRTLHRMLRDEGALSSERTTHIGRQICRSLREAHSHGVIHRDLKPANVFILNHGDERDVVKVLDFGLVKNLADKSAEELTQTGLFMGSPKYMSPEQIRGDECDGRVDIYALGVIMYEMLTGKVPFDRTNSVNILMAHIHEDVPPMAVMNPNVRVSPALEQVVRRCMAKQADARYPTMEALLSALKMVSGVHATMTGEFRAPNFAELAEQARLADQSRSVELPLPTSVTQRGDLLGGLAKGSITEIDHRLTLGAFGTPANGQTMQDTTMMAQASISAVNTFKSKPKTLALAAGAAVLVLGIGALFFGAQGADEKARAKQEDAAPLQTAPAASAPLAQPATAPSVQTSVLVTLRSTPAGAMVWVGDKEYGPTPTQVEWSGDDAALGREVTFRFQRRGFRGVTVTRQIRGPELEVSAPAMEPGSDDEAPPATRPGTRGLSPRSTHAANADAKPAP